ncbi:DsbA family protein [Sphaerisporangium fuscum]|uniref:DsbA family protein n=1 Tax=Sphaerisporangium fuscum TaxID=2835868 RepID=UPI001BDBFF3E|nr:thioredoxin domain-containing protein [Sphaerisporangium fuscum]
MGKAARDVSARERIKAQRELERKQEQRRRLATIITVVVVALVAVGGGWWYVQSGKSETLSGQLAPITVQSDGTIVMAKPGVEKPVLDVYEDFQCPACKMFEETSSATVKNMAAAGQVKVQYHPINIFTMEPTSSNSMRASAAARCVPGGSQWMAFHDKLFKQQPPEDKQGFALDDLVKWGKDAGVTDPGFEACVKSQKHVQAQTQYSQTASKMAPKGTPTLRLNGTELDNKVAFTPASLRQAILDAAK